jgi:hypothetical protein
MDIDYIKKECVALMQVRLIADHQGDLLVYYGVARVSPL